MSDIIGYVVSLDFDSDHGELADSSILVMKCMSSLEDLNLRMLAAVAKITRMCQEQPSVYAIFSNGALRTVALIPTAWEILQ